MNINVGMLATAVSLFGALVGWHYIPYWVFAFSSAVTTTGIGRDVFKEANAFTKFLTAADVRTKFID